MGAEVVKPKDTEATVNAKGGRLIDFMIASKTALHMIKVFCSDGAVPWSPHLGIWVGLGRLTAVWQTNQVWTPKNVGRRPRAQQRSR